MNFILAACVRNGATAKYCLGDWSAGQIKCCAMPAHDHCCVPDCNNRWNRNPELSFHTFPKNKEQKCRWILAIKRDEAVADPGFLKGGFSFSLTKTPAQFELKKKQQTNKKKISIRESHKRLKFSNVKLSHFIT